MFGIGGWEFVLIVILALMLFGPDKLPQFARTLGRFMREFKRYQDLMEATIRAEMFNADPSLRKDAFEAAKEARKRGAGGGFTELEPEAEPEAQPEGEGAPEAEPEGEPAPESEGEQAPEAEAESEGARAAEPASETPAEAEQSGDEQTAEREGERPEA